MAPVFVTLSDLEHHSPVAGLLKCNSSNTCAAFYLISTDSVLAQSLSKSWASWPIYSVDRQIDGAKRSIPNRWLYSWHGILLLPHMPTCHDVTAKCDNSG